MGMTEGYGAAHAQAWEHTALAVGDLTRAVDFYRDAFGYEVIPEPQGERPMTEPIRQLVGLSSVDCELAQLRSAISGHVLELIAFRDIPPGAEDHGPTRPGFGHLSFVVDDLEAAVAEVARLGARVLGRLTLFDGDRRAYCREPSGTVVELVEKGESGQQAIPSAKPY
jgi:predicted enzyme related to lactoylglutathione lyase